MPSRCRRRTERLKGKALPDQAARKQPEAEGASSLFFYSACTVCRKRFFGFDLLISCHAPFSIKISLQATNTGVNKNIIL